MRNIGLLLLGLLVGSQVVFQSLTFRPAKESQVPRGLVALTPPCEDEEDRCAWRFSQSGEAWRGDVNGDGQDEWIIFPGTGGSGGANAYVYERRKGKRQLLLDYFPYDNRFYIVPTTHGGYHDLCLDDLHCFLWNGTSYVAFTPRDYRRLSISYFTARDGRDASIRWLARYVGLSQFQFEPDWHDLSSPLAGDLGLRGKNQSRVRAEIKDDSTGVRWVSEFKAGVWGVKGKRAFLVLPRPDYKGCERLELEGDWLVIYGERVGMGLERPVARYNRRTGDMRVETRSPFWLEEN